ncbi:hypothetical protein [Candidatus Mycoplasma haematominutum]|uniref:Uncharacterized protein n=1 Tax=Candidatus Mycoplasma haematominutum 'Birmingham 1' TaxID=1116213 RepID=G8C3F0_9MOLU|nr:hypothetical protein [Candidatus Mycoplasma haematominutum]CCE66848.1 hypothetical protein MHM_03300 [Candidatus Mycoplasma haematominutum 'Birmingham 1']
MSHARTKLIGALSLLLGAPSGASLAVSELNFLDLGKLFSPLGGGSSLTTSDYPLNRNTLDSGDKVQSIKIELKEKQSPSSLDSINGAVNFTDEKDIDHKFKDLNIQDIYMEAEKEEKTLTLREKGKVKVRESLSKVQKHLPNYQTGKTKFDRWLQMQSKSSRRKRAAAHNSFLSLTRDERTALLEMFKEFEKLEGKQSILIPQLAEIDSNLAGVAAAQKVKPKSVEIERKLREINWMTGSKIKYTQPTVRKRRWGASSPALPDWKKWELNPFNLFLENQSIYTSLIRKVEQAKQNKQYQQRSEVFSRGIQAKFWPSSQTQEFQQRIERAEEDITFQVASRLLSWMNQI